MTKVAIIVGALLLFAGVATASTLTGFVPTNESPTVSIPDDGAASGGRPAGTTTGTATEREPGEDIRGNCDEAEHANDPACAGVPATRTVDDDDHGDDDRGRNRGPSANSGPGSVNSGHDDRGNDDRGGGGDSGSGSGHSGGGGDDD